MRRSDSAMDMDVPKPSGKGNVKSFKDALDVRVLGVCSGSGLNQLDFALVRYRQASPHTALCLEHLQVCAAVATMPALLIQNSLAPYLLPNHFVTISSTLFARSSASLRR
jgi:hypothetical protein